MLAETRMPARSRKPGDVVIRRQRLRPQHIAVRPRRIVRRGPTPPIILIAGFIALIAIGTALLSLPIASVDGGWTNLETSLFTATSASLVTGLVVVDTSTYWSGFGQAVILMLIQIGGLGFMTGATLLFPDRRPATRTARANPIAGQRRVIRVAWSRQDRGSHSDSDPHSGSRGRYRTSRELCRPIRPAPFGPPGRLYF